MHLSTESYTCTLMSLVWAVVDTLSGKVDMSAHFILYIEMMIYIDMSAQERSAVLYITLYVAVLLTSTNIEISTKS